MVLTDVDVAFDGTSPFAFIAAWNGFVLFAPQYDGVTSTWQFDAIDWDFGVDAINVESVDSDDVSLSRIFWCINWLYYWMGGGERFERNFHTFFVWIFNDWVHAEIIKF